jgi:homoserine O-succinyltransferase
MDGAGLAVTDDADRRAWAPVAVSQRRSRPITIGLVNNMPDAALIATEGQFRKLIETAGGGRNVRLKLFSIPEIARSDAARDAMHPRYASTETLPAAGVDALIVTGAEPLAADLRDEPYWRSLADLVDWAAANTVSTLWSCLAAHAAVLHMDGIVRRRLPAKCSGVFPVAKAARHPLLAGHTGALLVPHSRLNALDEGELTAKDYTILTRSDEIGVDAFVRQQRGSLFVFLQGHPEYDADSLALEYRRDLRRFLRGERSRHPIVPVGYFDPKTEQALIDLAAQTVRHPQMAVLSTCGKLINGAPPVQRWKASTAHLYRNWIALIAARCDLQARPQDSD